MSNAKTFQALVVNGRWAFFQEFMKYPFQIGSIIPSSRFLERRIVETARIDSAKTVVELGPGIGGTTRAILRAMAKDARLLSIEINRHFHALVSGIEDDRLIAHLGNAVSLRDIISMYGLGTMDVVISGIPFSTMSPVTGSEIIDAISGVLTPGGRFVAYQTSRRVASLCRPVLGPGEMQGEFLNIPPMRVYRWEKARL